MNISKLSIFGKVNTMDISITEEKWNEIQSSDKCIQRMCPELRPCEREFLINGTTPKDWEELYGGCTFNCPCKYDIIQIEEP